MLVSLNLSTEEHEILKNILESEMSELRTEIVGTDSWDFKQMLKSRKQAVVKVLEALTDTPVPGTV